MTSSDIAFDYVRDIKLRENLASDYDELLKCMKIEAWKASVVLGGSILEAVIVDALLVEKEKVKDEVTKLPFGVLIEKAHSHNLISDRVKSLSLATNDYRNLIHPGKRLRLGEDISQESAEVTFALLKLALHDIKGKQEQHGFTPDSLVNKVVSDGVIVRAFEYQLSRFSSEDLERLLLVLIPDKVEEIVEDEFFEAAKKPISNLAILSANTYSQADDSIRLSYKSWLISQLNERSRFDIDSKIIPLVNPEVVDILSEDENDFLYNYLISSLSETPRDQVQSNIIKSLVVLGNSENRVSEVIFEFIRQRHFNKLSFNSCLSLLIKTFQDSNYGFLDSVLDSMLENKSRSLNQIQLNALRISCGLDDPEIPF